MGCGRFCSIALLVASFGCDDGHHDSPVATAPPEVALVETILDPEWPLGKSWSIEVRGSFEVHRAGRRAFWGVTHFVVETASEGVQRLGVEHFPIAPFGPQRRCRGHLFIEREPMRSAGGVIEIPGYARTPGELDAPRWLSYRFPGWPAPSSLRRAEGCLLALPTHPAARTDRARLIGAAQRVNVDGTTATFELAPWAPASPYAHITWRLGEPWWSRWELHHHTAEGEAVSAATSDAGHSGYLGRIEFAKLIAVDGEFVESFPMVESFPRELLDRLLPDDTLLVPPVAAVAP
jgi:hypothetical protein